MRALITALAFLAAGAAQAGDDFTLSALDGREVSLSDYRGEVVLVNFWATWCAPCQVEMPELQKIYAELGDRGLEILSVSVDDSRSKSKVGPLVSSKGYTFPVLLDTETEVVSRYNAQRVLPYTVIFDRSGEIAHRHLGYNPGDEATIRQEIEALLAAEAPAGGGPAAE